MATTILSRVKKGIALLDEKGPENWRGKVGLAYLNMGSLSDCVLGQVFDGYGNGISELWGDDRYGPDANVIQSDHGFDVHSPHTEIAQENLRKEWLRQLTE